MPEARSRRTRDLGILALAGLAPMWGYSWVVSKVALGYSEPLTFAALITGLGAVGLFVVLAVARRPLRPSPLGRTALIGLLQTTLFNGLAIAALTVGGAGKVSVLVYTMPFWLLTLAWLFLGERLRGLQWPAVGLAFSGLILVVRPWDIGGALGGVLACGAGLAWAAAGLLVKLLQRRTDCDTLSLTAWQLAFGCVPLIVAAGLVEGSGPIWTTTFIACLTYQAVLANAVCLALWIFALRALPAGVAGMGTLGVPVVGVIAAWLQLGEVPAIVEGVGMAMILIALAVLAAAGIAAGRNGGRQA
jgi:drug/metabolite transporter (DMT)-like permease